MSTLREDPLYQIFEEHLHSGLYDEAPTDQFVRDVVEFYFTTLKRTGHIPQQLQDPLRVDLAEDVVEMLKRKIYGHYGIVEYNRIRLKKSS